MSEDAPNPEPQVVQQSNLTRDLRERARGYVEALRGPDATLGDVMAILTGLNAPWQIGRAGPAPRRAPGLLPSVTGTEGIEDVRALASHPFIYRLNYIKQLSTTHLWTNLDATHNRLSHSLGTAQWAWHFLDAIDRNQPDLIQPTERRAVLILALIHDAFHGPLGHSLEIIREAFSPLEYKKLDKWYLQRCLRNREHPLCLAIAEWVGPDEAEPVYEALHYLADAAYCREERPDKYFLAQIVDYHVDADRLDYLIRDSAHLGEPPPPVQRLAILVEGVRVHPARHPDRVADEDPLGPSSEANRSVQTLCFNLEHRDTVDEFLNIRRDFYSRIYEHSRKLILDEMLAHALFYALQAKGAWLPMDAPAEKLIVCAEILYQIMRLTDEQLFQFLYEIADPSLGQGYHALEIVHLVRTNHPWVEIHREDLSARDAESVLQKIVELQSRLNDAVTEPANGGSTAATKPDRSQRSPKPSMPIHEREAIIRRLAREANWGRAELLKYFELSLAGGFSNKHRIEKDLWHRAMSDAGFAAVFGDYVREKFPKEPQAAYDALRCVPHVHLSMPAYVGRTAEEVIEGHREQAAQKRVAYYDPRGKVSFLEPQVATRKEETRWVLIASTPRRFADNPQAREILVRELNDMLFVSMDWLSKSYWEGSHD